MGQAQLKEAFQEEGGPQQVWGGEEESECLVYFGVYCVCCVSLNIHVVERNNLIRYTLGENPKLKYCIDSPFKIITLYRKFLKR